MYTACHNYGLNYGDVDKGHRANGFTTDGGFCEYQVNNINTLVAIPDAMSDEEATLVVTAGTAMYGPDRARRAGRGRERGRHRPRPDRAARCRGAQGARRASR
jgi:NADPH:quinone reductase-like Zn-dependent oxidoreductase